jgi:DNA-binding transcriptional LysR family regulator
MDTLTSLRVFCRVAELKSFTGAAERLDMSPTMASRHVRCLEERLGTRLLNRTSRHVSLTETGSLYFNQAKQTLDALEEVEATVGNIAVEPRGTLKLSAPVWFANAHFSRAIADFEAAYPLVRLDVHLSGRLVNLVEEGFDLAFRVTAPGTLDPGLIARTLAEMPFVAVAAPSYLDRAGRPETLAELEGRTLLTYSGARSAAVVAFDGPDGQQSVRFNPGLQSGNESLLHLTALDGLGIAILPEILVERDLAEGRLEALLPGVAELRAKVYSVYPSRKFLSAKVRTFIDFISDSIKALQDDRKFNHIILP